MASYSIVKAKNTDTKLADFFVVGAPKCGTTSLCDYLDQHPDIFISKPKEPGFFNSDLFEPNYSIEEYQQLFEAGKDKLCGEGTVWYLYSKVAAKKIKAYNPEAKIIIMLREPVSLLYSMHSQRLVCANEDITDFKSALEAESDRRQGQRLPKTPNKIPALNYYFYSEIIKFAEQIDRYFTVFGRENVHVVIFDEFKSDTALTYQSVLNFLGVNSDFVADFEIRNPNTQIKNFAAYQRLMNPPTWMFALGRRITPPFLVETRRKLAWNLIAKAKTFLKNDAPRSSLDPELEAALKLRFSGEVKKISDLLGRDLTHWSQI